MPDPSQPSREVIRNFLSNPCFATTLHAISLMSLEPDMLYGSETSFTEIFAELEDLYSVEIDPTNKEKLQAIVVAVSTDSFHNDPQAFRAICNTLLHGDPMFDMFDDLTIAEILWGVYEISINQEETEDQTLSPAVEKLIDKEIAEEREDNAELETLEKEPYYQKFLQAARTELFLELKKLFKNLEPSDLPEL